MTAITWEAVAIAVYKAGFRGEPGVIMTAITQPESGRDPSKVNVNAHTRDDSWGLAQINMTAEADGPKRLKALGLTSKQQLLDPYTNMRAAYMISSGGTSFGAWSTYNHNLHKPYLPDARAAFDGVTKRSGGTGGITGFGQWHGGSIGAPSGSDVPWWDRGPTGEILTDPSGGGASVVVQQVLTDDFTAAIPKGISPNYDPATHADGFIIRGKPAETTILFDGLTTGSVSLTTEQVSEFALSIPPGGAIHDGPWTEITNLLEIDTPVDWFDLQLVVESKSWGPGPSGQALYTARMRDAGASKLRAINAAAERDWANQSPTEVLQELAGEAGLRYVARGTYTRDQIIRKGEVAASGSTHAKPAESSYELGQRLAKEEGFWFFISGGVMYFAPPSWLIARMPRFGADLGGVGAPSDGAGTNQTGVMGMPTCDYTRPEDLQPGMPSRKVTIDLPRRWGEQVRPGFGCDFQGPPGFIGTYIVTSISWPIDGGIAPAKIDLQDPTDPVPEPDTQNPADGTDATSADPTLTGSGGTTLNLPAARAGHSAMDMTTIALRQVGDRYVYGAETSPDDPDPSAFDCSELIQWACSQVGVMFADGDGAQIAAIERAHLVRTVEQASRIRGAFLWFPGHCAISLGDGRTTVEARGRAYGVVQAPIAGRGFQKGGLIPGLIYPSGS